MLRRVATAAAISASSARHVLAHLTKHGSPAVSPKVGTAQQAAPTTAPQLYEQAFAHSSFTSSFSPPPPSSSFVKTAPRGDLLSVVASSATARDADAVGGQGAIAFRSPDGTLVWSANALRNIVPIYHDMMHGLENVERVKQSVSASPELLQEAEQQYVYARALVRDVEQQMTDVHYAVGATPAIVVDSPMAYVEASVIDSRLVEHRNGRTWPEVAEFSQGGFTPPSVE